MTERKSGVWKPGARVGLRSLMAAWTVVMLGLAGGVLHGTTDEPVEDLPHFQEVLRLLRAHLPGVTEKDLNAAMVEGMLEHFRPRVLLQSGQGAAVLEAEGGSGVRRTTVYGGAVGYLGVKAVVAGLAEELSQARGSMQASNQLEGWVLDLRACVGRDYPAAARVADLFVNTEEVLIEGDDFKLMSSAGGEGVLPVVVLVNGETVGAAEALAGAMREAGPAVVMGSRTAGEAFTMRSFDLGNGQQLWIAGAVVSVGREVSLQEGVVPDLEVVSQPFLDRLWVEDPYRVVEGETGMERPPPPRVRFDEAALVREHGGLTNEPAGGAGSVAEVDAEDPVLQDPALVRALALLKGLGKVRGGIRR